MASLGPATSENKGTLAVVWASLRILTGLWGAAISSFVPLTAFEQSVAVWPPATLGETWFTRVFLAPWVRWDVHSYLKIISQGYRLTDGTTQFHPLFPWLAAALSWIIGQPLLSLILLSSLAGLLLLFVFERLACLDWEEESARASTLLLLFSPFAFVLFVPYTEGLFLLWAVLCLLAARRQHWWRAGLAGLLATLTRQQGVFLLVPLAWEMWEASKPDLRSLLKNWRMWGALGLIPLGWTLWLVYRALILQDLDVDLSTTHAFIYSLLISPNATIIVPVQTFLWPWEALGIALKQVWLKPSVDLVTNLVLAAGFVGLVALSWSRLRISYRLYTVIIVLVSFSYYTGPVWPYMGLPRHLFLAFPVFLALGDVIAKPWKRLLIEGIGVLMMLFLLLLFLIESWVP